LEREQGGVFVNENCLKKRISHTQSPSQFDSIPMENNPKRGGRPRKSDDLKRSETISFKTTKVQFERLKQQADQFDMTLSDYCHKHILSAQITAPFTEEELSLKRGLVAMANNLNQLAHRANAAGIETVGQSAQELLLEIKIELRKFRQ
jgi:hypothetical protein